MSKNNQQQEVERKTHNLKHKTYDVPNPTLKFNHANLLISLFLLPRSDFNLLPPSINILIHIFLLHFWQRLEMVSPEHYLSSAALRRFLIGFVLFVGVSLSSYILFRAADVAGFPIMYSVDSSSRFGYVSNAAAPPPVSSPITTIYSLIYIFIQ